ncbi:MAG: copper amine oxidase N-terminal domain-containing protein, partial [Bacillota bacterium]
MKKSVSIKKLKLIPAILITLIVLVFIGTAPASAAPRLLLDGKQLSFDVPPVTEQGRTLVPLRTIFEALGADVRWDGTTWTVTATKGQTTVRLTVGVRTAYKNGAPVNLDVPAKIVNGRTLVPLRFVSEALGAKVNWDTKTQVVTIRSFPSAQGLQIVLKDVGFPEVKYLQPTIKEVQLQDESGKWITIWSSPEGKAVKLTPEGAEVVLATVSVPAGTFVGTRLLVSTIDVEADINRDGDTSDKNVEIILTEEEFQSLPQKEKPQAPQKPQAPAGGGQQP